MAYLGLTCSELLYLCKVHLFLLFISTHHPSLFLFLEFILWIQLMGLLPYALHNLLHSKYALLHCEYLFYAFVISLQLHCYLLKYLAHLISVHSHTTLKLHFRC